MASKRNQHIQRYYKDNIIVQGLNCFEGRDITCVYFKTFKDDLEILR